MNFDCHIEVTKALQNTFEDLNYFENSVKKSYKLTNPDAHPLVLSTLIKAKWFEVMNTMSY